MTRRKTFDASRRNRQREPLIFTLVYDRYRGPKDDEGEPTEPENPENWEQQATEFKAKGWLPALTFLELGDTWDTDRQDASLKGLTRFFQTVMGRAEYERFAATLADEEVMVEASQLAEISQWVFEELGGRPTGRSSDSSPGPSSTGNGSTGSVPSPASTQPSLPPTGS